MPAVEARAEYWRSLGTASTVFDAEIKQVIRDVDAIDTRLMHNTTIVRMVEREGHHKFEIDTTFYFKFVDRGTKYISAREILRRWQDRQNVRRQIGIVLANYEKWRLLDPMTQSKLTAYL